MEDKKTIRTDYNQRLVQLQQESDMILQIVRLYNQRMALLVDEAKFIINILNEK